jgi:hypothetical protein
MFNVQDMIAHGGVYVCASCKPIFLQKLAEGAEFPKASKRGMPFWLLLVVVAVIAIALGLLVPAIRPNHRSR